MSAKLLRIAIAAAGVCAALWVAAVTGHGQAPTSDQAKAAAEAKAKALKAKGIADALDGNARVLTVFDRQGKVVTTVGERGIYSQPVFSPDGTRLAVSKRDLENRTSDIWVLDVATGESTRITSNQPREGARWPVWSPDGRRLAYVALRTSYQGLYLRAANGEGTEELLYQYPGANMILNNWSADGQFLTFSSTDLTGGVLYALPLGGAAERKPVEVFRSESQIFGPFVSPDARVHAYQSDESGKIEVYLRPFKPSADAGAAPAAAPRQVSTDGGNGPVFWRHDGKELYFVAADSAVMAVEVGTAPTFEFGQPKVLFRPLEAIGVTPVCCQFSAVSPDGQRIVIAMHPKPVLQQITMFDRGGKIVQKIGAPGRYAQPQLSPDGRRVAVMRFDPRTQNVDVWTFDVASGKGAPVTNDAFRENAPIWSPDGTQVAYVSTRGKFTGIYRKAWDGSGKEEQVFQYTPGAGMVLTDWSADGKFLTFHDGCSGVLHVLPLGGDQKPIERKATEWLRDEYNVAQARISPDSRSMAYLSNESKTTEEIDADIFDVYVRAFDASHPDASAGDAKPVQVSTAGALGMIVWRQDGKEMYYLTPDWDVMAVDVTTTPAFRAGTPRRLFNVPVGIPAAFLFGNPQQWKNVSRDGQRFVFVTNVPVR